MDLGWKWLIELAFLAVMVTGVVIVGARPGLEPVGRGPGRVRRCDRSCSALLRLCMPRRDEIVSEVV